MPDLPNGASERIASVAVERHNSGMISPRFVRVLPAFAATLVAVAFTAACAEDETQFSGPGGTASLLTPGGNVTPAAGSGGSAGTAGTAGTPTACVASSIGW